ncbi:MAG: hypothetical protein ACI8PZ_002111 [Myxococcota bacterium]|jgi:hypothetical protein
MAPTFLQLAPEFGGTRFGPFPGIIHVGSDGKRCQLTLSPSQGILPHHASVMPQPDGTFVVGPVQAEAGVFLIQAGNAQVWPVRSMVQANVGDQLVFGTPHGPRFQLVGGAAPTAAPGMVAGAGGGASSTLATGIASEVQRRAMARMLTTGPFRDVYYFWNRYKVGTFSNPYYIVGAAMAVVGAIAAGGLSCTGIAAAVWASMRY